MIRWSIPWFLYGLFDSFLILLLVSRRPANTDWVAVFVPNDNPTFQFVSGLHLTMLTVPNVLNQPCFSIFSLFFRQCAKPDSNEHRHGRSRSEIVSKRFHGLLKPSKKGTISILSECGDRRSSDVWDLWDRDSRWKVANLSKNKRKNFLGSRLFGPLPWFQPWIIIKAESWRILVSSKFCSCCDLILYHMPWIMAEFKRFLVRHSHFSQRPSK